MSTIGCSSSSEEETKSCLVDSLQLAKDKHDKCVSPVYLYGSVKSNEAREIVNNPNMSSQGASSVFTLDTFDQFPVYADCPVCKKRILTRLRYRTGWITWFLCGLLMILGCWIGCCLLPFCVSTLKDVEHLCPTCNTKLGTYKRCNSHRDY